MKMEMSTIQFINYWDLFNNLHWKELDEEVDAYLPAFSYPAFVSFGVLYFPG